MQDLRCRLCAGATTPWTRLRVLRRHDVQYVRCETCGSVQTEPPTWLEEAYAPQGTGLDTGAAQRGFETALRTAALLSFIAWPRERVALDYGAGMGLFARLMRDRGYDFHAYDPHVLPFYMDQFCVDDPKTLSPMMVTAHEVLEHLPNPATDLEPIFGRGAELVMVTTELFQNQGPDWDYLAPHHGQHVFFYSPRAMQMIAERFGYAYAAMPMMHVFWRPELAERTNMLLAMRFANEPARFGDMMLKEFLSHAAAPYQYAMRDMETIAKKAT